MRRSLSTVLALALAASLLLLSGAAVGAISQPKGKALTKASSSSRGPRGSRGAAGSQGPAGPAGPVGAAGPGPRVQSIAIDWQNGAYEGHDVATFSVPGIGSGEVKCSLDTQWIRFTPSDQGADTEMWAAIMRENKLAVRAAARRSYSWGPDFNLGLNQKNALTEEPQAHGQMRGIISTRGPIGAGAATNLPAPATFSLSWYWYFVDPHSARCYVTGVVVTGS